MNTTHQGEAAGMHPFLEEPLNAYRILKVNQYANPSTRSESYRRVIGKFDPDAYSGQEGEAIRARIEEAYEVLLDDCSKADHDSELRKTWGDLFLFTGMNKALNFFDLEWRHIEQSNSSPCYVTGVYNPHSDDAPVYLDDETRLAYLTGAKRDARARLATMVKEPEQQDSLFALGTTVYHHTALQIEDRKTWYSYTWSLEDLRDGEYYGLESICVMMLNFFQIKW